MKPGSPGAGALVTLRSDLVDLLVGAVRQLGNLSQLAVLDCIEDGKVLPGQKECAAAAGLFAAVAPCLRYIRVYELCWRVFRSWDGTFRLEELEEEDIVEVELFQLTTWEPEETSLWLE
jgi:hypothetical protein